MKLPQLMADTLGVRSGEERPVILLLLHSFAMGLSTVFFETAASALFLARFGSGVLPWVYIAAAIVNTVTGLVYAGIRERAGFERLMRGTLLFLLASVFSLWGGQRLTEAAMLTFGLLVFYRVLSALTDLEYWAVATRIFDVRQAKRLFGIVGSGEVVARIAGSFSVPLLVGLIGVPHLMLVSAAALVGCLVLACLLLRSRTTASPPAQRETRKIGGGLRSTFRLIERPYLVLLFATTITAILGKYFVDFAFLAEMKSRYAAARELASFFGLFSGATQVLSLLTRLFISGPLLNRFGIRVGLLILPLTHAVCTVLLIVQGGWLSPESAAVFWLVIANQGIYKVLKHPIDNPSFKVLYQPLRPDERLGAQIAVETIVTPITTGVAGAVMLFFTLGVSYHPARFAWVLLATFVAWIVVVVRTGRAYPEALSEALKERVADEQLSFDDPKSRAILEQTLRTGRPPEVLFALELLERAEHPRLNLILSDLLDHPVAEVRSSVLARLERQHRPEVIPAVRRCLERETSARERAAALRCLCALGGEAVASEVSRYLEDPDPIMHRAALIGLLRLERDTSASFATRYLRSLIESHHAEKRALAAQVLGEVARLGFRPMLRRLIRDDVTSVRRAALAAAGKVKDPELWRTVARRLADDRLAGVAAAALTAGGEEVLPALETVWRSTRAAKIQTRLLRTAVRAGEEKAIPMLRTTLGADDPRVRQAALEGLRIVGDRPDDDGRKLLEERVLIEAAEAAWVLASICDVRKDEALDRLSRALKRDWIGGRDRMLLGLSFLHDRIAILRARDHLSDAAKDKRAYALEILDVELPRELKDILLPLCEDLDENERLRRLGARFPQENKDAMARLADLIGAGRRLLPWSRACALEAVGRFGQRGLTDRLAAVVSEEGAEPLVVETARWAMMQVSGTASVGEGRTAMLTLEKAITLKAVPMFTFASEDVLADIAAILEETEVPAGEVIFEKGEVGDSLYIVVEGRVRVYDGDRTITSLGENEIFGELALLDPEPRNASIAAVDATRLFRLDREAFAELMAGNIEIVRGVLSVLCDRLRRKASETKDPANAAGSVGA